MEATGVTTVSMAAVMEAAKATATARVWMTTATAEKTAVGAAEEKAVETAMMA